MPTFELAGATLVVPGLQTPPTFGASPQYDNLVRCGGSELAMALDMRFAARGKAGIGQTEALMGIVPGGGATPTCPG